MGTLLSDLHLRFNLNTVSNSREFVRLLIEKSGELREPTVPQVEKQEAMWSLGSFLWENIRRRYGYWYISDYKDGVFGHSTLSKTVSTTLFLYFSVLLPCIAFGALASINTKGQIDEIRTLWGQVIGGLLWAFFTGQPMLIIATTALVSLYSKVVFDMSTKLDVPFGTLYAMVGLWNTLFIFLYSFTGISNWVRFSTRSVEEIFAMFITVCFAVDAIGGLTESKYQ